MMIATIVIDSMPNAIAYCHIIKLSAIHTETIVATTGVILKIIVSQNLSMEPFNLLASDIMPPLIFSEWNPRLFDVRWLKTLKDVFDCILVSTIKARPIVILIMITVPTIKLVAYSAKSDKLSDNTAVPSAMLASNRETKIGAIVDEKTTLAI